jgi:dipeptidyl aminopeptidase/acylaminoacyl peptidase
MFVLHGTHDSLVPVEQARHFVAALRGVSRQPVVFAELPGAQHAFDLFPSLRCEHTVAAIERFLSYVYAQVLRHRAESGESVVAVAAS